MIATFTSAVGFVVRRMMYSSFAPPCTMTVSVPVGIVTTCADSSS